jgi:hypothetical protein
MREAVEREKDLFNKRRNDISVNRYCKHALFNEKKFNPNRNRSFFHVVVVNFRIVTYTQTLRSEIWYFGASFPFFLEVFPNMLRRCFIKMIHKEKEHKHFLLRLEFNFFFLEG